MLKRSRWVAFALCVALLLLCCSCEAGDPATQAAGAAKGQSGKDPEVQSGENAEPDPDDPANLFISRITETGTGLVREVPPYAFHMTKPLSLEERSQYVRWIGKDIGTADIRSLDCMSNLTPEQTQTLLKAIPNITYNSDTIWPDSLPDGFDPAALLEAGKNPGLGVRALHAAGITGKGVSIAIIDQTLLTSHVEYRDNLALYEEIHVTEKEGASMHGAAVSSIAVGKNCGVAPDAKLYYWAVNLIKDPTKQVEQHTDNTLAFKSGLAAAMDRLLEVNETLPDGEKSAS